MFNIIGAVFVCCLFCGGYSYSQESLSNPGYNARLFYKKGFAGQYKKSIVDTVSLPFIDDFSLPAMYPDSSLWMDKYAFVNRSYPVDPPSIGVATLDGLNEKGMPYNSSPFSYGPADSLTSNPIALGSITPADSVYFSFFYQPQGIGDYPNPEDTLLVEFKTDTGAWVHVWATPGDTIQPFMQVLIPVTDTAYLFDGFQFRFRNYATLSGNNDHWHIDYVRLDTIRHMNDTAINDVAIVSIPITILKNYTAMPWSQYDSSELENQHTIEVRNNFAVPNTKITPHWYKSIYLKTSATIDSSSIASKSIDPSTTITIPDVIPYYLDSIPGYAEDSVTIRTIYTIDAPADNNYDNDSVYFDQKFYNYYAYDDGSAEKAYGLFSVGAKLAYRFTLNNPDTIRAVAIHFAHMNADVSNKLFSLTVWQSIDEANSGVGDNIIYQRLAPLHKPIYLDTLNGFHIYKLDTPKVVSGTFYVGWIQTSPDILNIGFDVNTNHKQHIFYNVSGDWYNTSFNGSLMMRPILGDTLPWMTTIIEKEPLKDQVSIYPNPVTGKLYFHFNARYIKRDIDIEVYDIYGRLMLRSESITDNYIDVAGLPFGIYLFKAYDHSNNRLYVRKFVVSEQ